MSLQVRLRVSKEVERTPPNTDMLWINRHYPKLRKEYPDKWIAVRDATVILSDNDLDSLLDKLKNQFGSAIGYTVEFIGGRPRISP